MKFHEPGPLDQAILNQLPHADAVQANTLFAQELKRLDRKIVVLDDDPTGIQTVHGVHVYTDWQQSTMDEGFAEKNNLFFILTNSRSFTVEQTLQCHKEIAQRIWNASQQSQKPFLLISRGDSTLRGHYPLETETLRTELEHLGHPSYDAEILIPFFPEGGRYTFGDIHYVLEKDHLVPAGLTEFARDKSFGYRSSHLGDFVAEKTLGHYRSNDCVFISLEELAALDLDSITHKLQQTSHFQKVIVNATTYADLKVFCAALCRAIHSGKEFLFRSAAPLTKILGGISDRPLLRRNDLIDPNNTNGGIILVGSHVNKTSRQLEALHTSEYPIRFLEFNQHLVLTPGGLEGEVKRVVTEASDAITNGQTVAVYTRRDRFDLPDPDPDKQLEVSVRISDSVTSIISKLPVRPSFIIAKGGITSSDVGVKALQVHCATVMGQLRPGVPVWMTGSESRFPNLPYVIFPGNVGEDSTLKEIVELLIGR